MKLKYKKLITSLYKYFKHKKASDSLRVLMYHDIGDQFPQKSLWKISKKNFVDHVKFLYQSNKNIIRSDLLLSSMPKQGLVITFDDGFMSTFKIAAPILIEHEMPFTVFITTGFLEGKNKYVDKNTLQEFADHPLISIGSHGVNHIKLTQSGTLFEARSEIVDSKKYLEDLMGKEVISFSFPYGAYNKELKEIVINSGYKLAFTSNFSFNLYAQDKFLVNRNEIWSTDSLQVFQEKLSGDWDWLRYRSNNY